MNSNIARVATALLIDYTSVYYIDPNTGYYECYSTNQGYQKLELQASGSDFFADAKRDIALVVCEEDKKAVFEALTRESLLRQFKDKNAVSIVYRLMIDGEPVFHTMRMLRDASDGEERLIFGVQNVDETIRRGQQTKTYNAIAKTLADRYATIYYIDLATDHYVEYSASNDYKELEVPSEGKDFFTETYKNVQRVIHPEDKAFVERIGDKSYMMSVTENGRKLRMEYRLLMNDGAHYVRLTAVRTEDLNHLIIALENIDDEKKNQEEMKAISEKNLVFSQIAESLANRYGMIYYMVTNCYLEFYTGKDGELEIRPGGTDFFGAAREKLLEDVIEDDLERVREATGKAGLMRWMDQEEAVALSFHKMRAGMPVPYVLQTIKTRESDVHHTVIGIRRVS